MSSRTWSEWWTGKRPQPMQPQDAAADQTLRNIFISTLDSTEEPTWYKASEIALQLKQKDLWRLGYETPEEAIPAIKELAWDMRHLDYCEISKGGKLVPEDVEALDVQGGVRIRRKL